MKDKLLEALKAGLQCANACPLNTTYHEGIMKEALIEVEKLPDKGLETFFVVAADPESFETMITVDMVVAFKKLMWFDASYVDEAVVEEFKAYCLATENWQMANGIPYALEWEIGGESNGTITFFRFAH